MTTEEGRSIPMSTDPARRLRLTLTDILAAIACIAIAFATLGPAPLVVLAVMTLIGMLLGGISAGIHLATHAIVAGLLLGGRAPASPEARRGPFTPTLLLRGPFGRLVPARGRLLPAIVGCNAVACLFGFVSWSLVGIDSS
jgi:hypothetical protein